jgi:hypothetical protein
MADTSNQALDFVHSVELPPEDTALDARIEKARDEIGPMADDPEGDETASVVGGSLASFTANLTGQNRSDTKNATLFAQLAADAAFNRQSQPMEWYDQYVEVMSQIGWNRPGFSFSNYTSGGTTVKLDEAVLTILGSLATANEIAMVSATMEALKDLSDDSKQMTVWDSKSSDGKKGNFQILPCVREDNGDVAMILTGMKFTAHHSESRFLWFSWSSDSIEIEQAAARFVLNEDVYKTVREAILERLGERATKYVAEIPLGD